MQESPIFLLNAWTFPCRGRVAAASNVKIGKDYSPAASISSDRSLRCSAIGNNQPADPPSRHTREPNLIEDEQLRSVVFGAVEFFSDFQFQFLSSLEYVTGLTSLHASGSSELTAVIFSFKNSKGVASNQRNLLHLAK